MLDGARCRASKEDRDAVRRLYYVAMTRARATLTLARLDAGNEILDGLDDHPSLFRRPQAGRLPAPGPMSYRYFKPALRDVDLGHAGRQGASSKAHQAIAALRVGDPLHYVTDERGIRLEDQAGVIVGKLSKHFIPPAGLHCQAARVGAVLVWRKSDSKPEYQSQYLCEGWEVVLPELVFTS